VLGGDSASALAAGSAVVVKAHEGHPELSARIAEIARDALAAAGAPEDALQLITGRDEGIELLQHPGVKAGAFTGSIAGGRALYDIAGARPEPIPFYGELGSLNPVVVTERAATERGDELAAGLAGSFTMGAGQFCTKPGVVFIPSGSGFADAVGARVGGSTPTIMLNDRIRSGYGSLAGSIASHDAVEIVAGEVPGDDAAVGPLVLRTGATALVRDGDVLLEEVFGPTTLLVEYGSADELHAALATVPGSLTGTVHAADGEDVSRTLSVLTPRVGRVLFDGWPTGVAVSWAQHHGGPYPATTSVFTSVGATAIRRFLRPLTYQSAPERVLPAALKDANPLGIPRRVDGMLETLHR
jgi:NADP-dependent aldehyde dehydrogenase